MKYKSVEELVSAIAFRCRELANMKLPELREEHPENVGNLWNNGIIDNRGQCVEAIIFEEFQESEIEAD